MNLAGLPTTNRSYLKTLRTCTWGTTLCGGRMGGGGGGGRRGVEER